MTFYLTFIGLSVRGLLNLWGLWGHNLFKPLHGLPDLLLFTLQSSFYLFGLIHTNNPTHALLIDSPKLDKITSVFFGT